MTGSAASALVLAEGRSGRSLSGPSIRGLELARALATGRPVTLAARGAEPGHDAGVHSVRWTRRRAAVEARRHDAVVAPWIPPYVLLAMHPDAVAVADLYDPAELELGELPGAEAGDAAAAVRAATALQLAYADVLLCANERQRTRLEQALAQLGAEPRPPRVEVVPFGLPSPPPPVHGSAIRDRLPGIARDDRVVLWWGSLWPWLDPETAIRACGLWSAERPDVKLVLTAGAPPDGRVAALSRHAEARALARSLGLLDRSVFFLDEWIEYGERHRYLADADVGIALHRATPEAALAARARYMDYLWCGVPCVLARGDGEAERFGRAGYATLVPAGDPAAVAAAVLALLDGDALRRARARAVPLADSYRWSRVVEPLAQALDELAGREPRRARRRGRLWADVAAYYRGRLTA